MPRLTYTQLLKDQLACYERIRDNNTQWLDKEKATTSNYNFYMGVIKKIENIKDELWRLDTVEF